MNGVYILRLIAKCKTILGIKFHPKKSLKSRAMLVLADDMKQKKRLRSYTVTK
jgi:hypothetical protein